jgi:hypothetical protein
MCPTKGMLLMAGEPQSLIAVDLEEVETPPPQAAVRLQVLSERPVGQRRAPAPAQSAPPVSPPPTAAVGQLPSPQFLADRRAARVDAALGAFDAIARILSIRLILLLGVIGAFGLAAEARDIISGGVFAAFCVLVVIPLVWLDHTIRRPTPGG